VKAAQNAVITTAKKKTFRTKNVGGNLHPQVFEPSIALQFMHATKLPHYIDP
jgi:hypothetical protein